MLAKEYALAAYQLSGNKLELISDLKEFIKALEENKDYFKLIDSPNLSQEIKKELVEKLVKNELLDLLRVLIDNKRFYLVFEILEQMQRLSDEDNNLMRIDLTSSVKLDDLSIKLIKDTLEKKYQKSIHLNLSVDKTLIKGIKLTYQDKLIDQSISNILVEMKNKIKEEKNG